MLRTRLLILERTGVWARAWRERPVDIRAHELRSLADLETELVAAPASMLFLEFEPANWESRCHAALKWNRQYAQVRMVALTTAKMNFLEPVLRELGVADVISHVRELSRVSGFVRRHMYQFPSADRTLLEQWLARVPWTSYSAEYFTDYSTENSAGI